MPPLSTGPRVEWAITTQSRPICLQKEGTLGFRKLRIFSGPGRPDLGRLGLGPGAASHVADLCNCIFLATLAVLKALVGFLELLELLGPQIGPRCEGRSTWFARWQAPGFRPPKRSKNAPVWESSSHLWCVIGAVGFACFFEVKIFGAPMAQSRWATGPGVGK